MADFQIVTISNGKVSVQDDSLGRSGNIVDVNQDGEVDYMMVGNSPPKPSFHEMQHNDDSERAQFCQKDTRKVLVINPHFQGMARLFSQERSTIVGCDAEVKSTVSHDDKLVQQAKNVFAEGKQRAEQLYTDFLGALKTGKVTDVDKYSASFIDSRKRDIFINFHRDEDTGLVSAIRLLDSGYPECINPGPDRPCPPMSSTDYLDVEIDDPVILDSIQIELMLLS